MDVGGFDFAVRLKGGRIFRGRFKPERFRIECQQARFSSGRVTELEAEFDRRGVRRRADHQEIGIANVSVQPGPCSKNRRAEAISDNEEESRYGDARRKTISFGGRAAANRGGDAEAGSDSIGRSSRDGDQPGSDFPLAQAVPGGRIGWNEEQESQSTAGGKGDGRRRIGQAGRRIADGGESGIDRDRVWPRATTG